MRLQIPIKHSFGDEQDLLDCQAIEDHIEYLLSCDLLGKWDGHESGQGVYTIFFRGESCQAMLEAVKADLKQMLPAGSYIELKDSNEKVSTIKDCCQSP